MIWRNSNSLTAAKRIESEELDCHQLIRLLAELCEHFLIRPMAIAPNPKLCLSLMRNRTMSWPMGMKQRNRRTILMTNSKNRNHKRSATIRNSSPKPLYHKRTIQPKNLRRKNWDRSRSRSRKLNLGRYSLHIWVRRLKYAMTMPLRIWKIGYPFLGIKTNKTSFWVCAMKTPMPGIHQP